MDTILVFAFTDPDGSLAKPALEAVNAGKTLAGELGTTFDVALVGGQTPDAATSLTNCRPKTIYALTGGAFAQPRYGTDSLAAEACMAASEAGIVIAAATSRISRALPGAAQRAGGRVDANCTAVQAADGIVQVTRWYYRQRMYAKLSREQRPWVITLAPGSQTPWHGEPGTATVTDVACELGDKDTRTTVKEIRKPDADAQTIRPDAETLLVAGAGWTKKQADGQTYVDKAETLIKDFLDKSGASLGSSKSLVDISGEGQQVISFLSHLHQVGQTGSTPRHNKGLAACCHGEEPHVVGWRFITERRAINLDANCGWAQSKADVLYVADAFAVLEEVNKLL